MKKIQLSEIMTKFPVTVKTEDPLSEVQDVFTRHPIHHIPVVDMEGKIAGIISKSDMDQLSWGTTLFKNPNRESYNEALYYTHRVKDVMTADVHTLSISITSGNSFRI